MANEKEYVLVKLGNVAESVTKEVIPDLETIENDLNTFKFNDARLNEHYSGYIENMQSASKNVAKIREQLPSFVTWLEQKIQEAKDTDAKNTESQNGLTTTVTSTGVNGGNSNISNTSDTSHSSSNNNVDTTSATPSDISKIAGAVVGISEVTPTNPEVTDTDHIKTDDDDPTFDAKKSEIQTTNPADLYTIDEGTWKALSTATQAAIVLGLRKLGYSEDNITDIITGKVGISKAVLNKIGVALKDTADSHSDLRQKLIDKYGFDLFTDKGKIIPSALASALYMDIKDSNDEYDLIKQLKDNYGVTLVDQTKLSNLKSQLESLYQTNPEIRNEILQKYGFDIYNDDGTVNESNLTMTMIMDDTNAEDEYDLNKLVNDKLASGPTVENPQEQSTDVENNPDASNENPADTENGTENNNGLNPEEIVVNPSDNSNGTEEHQQPSSYDNNGVSYNNGSYYNNTDYSDSIEEGILTEQPEEINPADETIDIVDEAEDDVVSRLTDEDTKVATVTTTIPPVETTSSSKKSSSGIATIAGIGATLAAAGAGAWYMKKKNDDEEDDEEDNEDYDDDSYDNQVDENAPIDISSNNEDYTAISNPDFGSGEEIISTGANYEKEKEPATKEFLNELGVDDDSTEEESVETYSAKNSQSEGDFY